MPDSKYCDGCGHPISRHYKDVSNIVRCVVVERGTSSRGVIGLPYEKDCLCKNGRLPKVKAVRTGTVYDDEIAIAHEDAARIKRYIQRAEQRSKKR